MFEHGYDIGPRYHEIDASHSPEVSTTDRLIAVLDAVVAG
jgi:hypothetical protein